MTRPRPLGRVQLAYLKAMAREPVCPPGDNTGRRVVRALMDRGLVCQDRCGCGSEFCRISYFNLTDVGVIAARALFTKD